MFDTSNHLLLTDLQIFLALVGLSLASVAAMLAMGRLRSGVRGKVRTLWLAIFVAGLGLALINGWIGIVAQRYPPSPIALISGAATGLIILALLVGIRVAALIIEEATRREADLKEARQALADHESGLQNLVAQRTQSLRKEITERRNVQKKLHLWNQQQERELAMAGRVQKALLPQVSSPDFCTVEMVYRPFAEVSGDTYMFATSDEEMSLVLADAMGHGVPAALVTQVIQTQFLRMGVSTDGSAMFAQLNDSLFRGAQVTYATASHIRVQAGGQAFFTSAGAPSLMIWRGQSKRMDLVDGTGFPLGMFDDVGEEYRVHALQLTSGDKLFMYTDGLSELKTTRGVHIGVDGLQAWFQQYAQGSTDSIAEQARQDLLGPDSTFELSDDITLAVMEFRGVPAAAG